MNVFGDLTGSYVLLEAMRWPRRELNLVRLAQRKDRVLGESGDGPCTCNECTLSIQSWPMLRQMDGILWKAQDATVEVLILPTFVSGYSRLGLTVNISSSLICSCQLDQKGFMEEPHANN